MQVIQGIPCEQFLITALRSSQLAGGEILSVYNTAFEVEYKKDESPLTLADKKSHEIIKKELETHFPRIPILSEEGKDIPYEDRKDWVFYWVVDPLDGTKEFVKRNGEFTVNIALMHRNRPVLGIIYIPVSGDFYYSLQNKGAYRLDGGGPVKELPELKSADAHAGPLKDIYAVFDEIVSASVRLPVSRNRAKGIGTESLNVIVSRSHMTDDTEAFLDKLRKKFKNIESISIGSSMKLCAIAEGRADVYPRFAPTMEWDTAAGQAIIEQSGGFFAKAGTLESFEYNKKSLVNPWFIAVGDKKFIEL
jgi:3'(2'), 5'-bisphosphate nucleotidase